MQLISDVSAGVVSIMWDSMKMRSLFNCKYIGINMVANISLRASHIRAYHFFLSNYHTSGVIVIFFGGLLVIYICSGILPPIDRLTSTTWPV